MLKLQSSKEEIREDILEFCQKKEIDIIMPLAKKGYMLFSYICDNNFKRFEDKGIKIISDRMINKQVTSLKNYNKKKFLLFDDSIKTGNHFVHVRDVLLKKLITSLKKEIAMEDIKIDFYFYVYIKPKTANINDSLLQDNLHFCKEVDIKEYYRFCLEEAIYFQKELVPISMDLPTYRACIKNIDDLKNIFINNDIYQVVDTDFRLGYEKFDLIVLILDIPELKEALDKFLIASTAKIRYRYNQKSDDYDILITPFVLVDSIKFDQLEEIYINLFDQDKTKTTLKTEMNLRFVKMLRKVVYVLSYAIGNTIKKELCINGIDIVYNPSPNSYFTKDDKDDKDDLENYYDNYDKIISKIGNFTYTPTYGDDEIYIQNYSYEEIKRWIYDFIVDHNKFGLCNYDYNFVELKELSAIYRNERNLTNFVVAIYKYIENFSISNEIEFNFKTSWLERGFASGECSSITLPIDDYIFYQGVTCFYERNNDYDSYVKKYSTFINKFSNLLTNEGYFASEAMTMDKFKYLAEYYRNVDKDTFRSKIESKCYLLEAEEKKNDCEFIKSRVDFFLDSDDMK